MLVTLVGAFPRSINILQTQSSDNDHLDRKARQPALANDGKAGSSAEKKLADFGTSNNITTSAFTFLINRTKKFLATYYNSCKTRLPFNYLAASYSLKNVC
jgi:hypothetical protein